ncbi:MAG: hypothetical protein ACI9MR_000123 [Myxococcota bacterium]|jgi:uncharacterized protein YaiL (DUF2058 family)
MTDMLDQLLKAGLVSDDAAEKAKVQTERATRDAQRPTRPPRPGQGGGARTRRGEQRPTSRPEPVETARRLDESAQAEVATLAKEGRADGQRRGGRRFYFESRAGKIPCVEVTPDASQALEKGRLGLVEDPDGDVWLVNEVTARAIAAIDVTWLRAFAPLG